MHSHRKVPWLPNHGAHTKPANCYALGVVLEFPSTAFKKRINNRNSDVCPETVTILLTLSNIVTKIVLNYKAEFIIEV